MKFLLPNTRTVKSLLLGAAFSSFALPAFATHLMGGEIIVTHLSGSSYEIRLTHYRDVSGIPLASTLGYNIITAGSSGYPTGTVVSRVAPKNAALSTSLLPNSPYNIEVGVYTDTVQLTAANKYFVMATECCRNVAIANMTNPSSEGFGLVTEFTVPATGTNSSPRFLTDPVPYFIVNTATNYNPLPSDPDGDSLVWALSTPKTDVTWSASTPTVVGNPVTGFTTPPGSAANPFTMNAVSGNISWTPNTMGNFVQSFQIDEYRNGVKIGSVVRDYQYIVVAADTTVMPVMQASANVQYDATNQYHYLYYNAGQPIAFTVTGTVGTTLDGMVMTAYSELLDGPAPQAQFTSTASGSTMIMGTLNWIPPTGYTKSVPVVVRQQNGHIFNDYTVLLKRNPEPASVRNTSPELAAKLYPNPTPGRFSVELTLPATTQLTVAVFNPMGQQVAQLHDGVAQGQVTIHCNQQLPQGLYFVRLQTTSGTTVLPLTIR